MVTAISVTYIPLAHAALSRMLNTESVCAWTETLTVVLKGSSQTEVHLTMTVPLPDVSGNFYNLG